MNDISIPRFHIVAISPAFAIIVRYVSPKQYPNMRREMNIDTIGTGKTDNIVPPMIFNAMAIN